MKKEDEIKRELSTAIENYDNLVKEGKMEEARQASTKVKELYDDLNAVRIAEAARKETAAKSMTEKEKKEIDRFSFRKFMHEASRKELSGFEAEMAAEAKKEAREFGMSVGDFGIPYVVLVGKRANAGQNVTTPADGGLLVQDEGMSYVEMLRNKLILDQVGATMLTGLTGNVPIVYGTKFQGEWLEEGAKSNIEKLKFTGATMKPKRLSIQGVYSNQLLTQASLDVEALVMKELVDAHAENLNSAAINGSGTGAEPIGLLNIAGIGSVVGGENGKAIDWEMIVALETAVAIKNADIGSLAYLTNTKVRGAMKTKEKSAGTARYLMEGNTVNGYKTVISNLVPGDLSKGTASKTLSAMIYGNFADLLIGWWGGLDVKADPYTMLDTDEVRIVARAFHDIAVRRKESFAAIKDIIA